MEPNIELAKSRDFGEIIGDTFLFIRQNFKNLLKYFFIFCGFFMVGGALNAIIQQLNIQGVIGGVGRERISSVSSFQDMWITYVFTLVFALCMYVTSTVTILSYISLYKQKGNIAPTIDEMWGYIKYYFLRIMGAVIVTSILYVVGFVFCILPGFWLFPILSLIFPIIIMENAGFGYAFNRSFGLIKDNWWVTAGTIFVVWIITYFMLLFATLPASAINVASLLTRGQRYASISTPMVVFSAMLQQLAQVILIIPLICIALCYYNLAETKEGTSLLDRISKFGGENPQTDLPKEEY